MRAARTGGPPRLVGALLRLAFMGEMRREILLGDLQEEYELRITSGDAPGTARRWYRSQVVRTLMGTWRSRITGGWEPIPEGDGMIEAIWQELRFGARMLLRSRAFTIPAILILALGIGANTLIYSVIDAAILHPFPKVMDRVVGIGTEFPRLDQGLNYIEVLSAPEYVDIRDYCSTLEDVVSFDMGNRQLSGAIEPTNTFTAFWWGDPLKTLQVSPVAGRSFAEDDIVNHKPVVMITWRIWQERFGGDPSVVGSPVRVNGEPYTLIGIVPQGVNFFGTDLWMPMWADPAAMPRNRRQFQVLGRLTEDGSLEAVNTEMGRIAAQIQTAHAAEFPEYEGWRLHADTWTGLNVYAVRPFALVIMGAVAFVLLLVCSNIATMLLGRAAGRRGEFAVRAALGARRTRLARQLMVEALLLASLGALIGTAGAYVGLGALKGVVPNTPFFSPADVSINVRVLMFTGVVSLIAALLFSLMPVLQMTRANLGEILGAERSSATSGRPRMRLQRIFVGVQVMLALILLSGAGLLMNSFVRLRHVEPGFDPSGVLSFRLTLPWEKYEPDEMVRFFGDLQQQISGMPGVQEVGIASQYPPRAFSTRQLWSDELQIQQGGRLPSVYTTVASVGYFESLRIPVLQGRSFEESDREAQALRAVINEPAARRFFPGGDPIGGLLHLSPPGQEGPSFEVVGVVAGTHNAGLALDPAPEVYALMDQMGGSWNQLFFMVRTTGGDPNALVPAIRTAVLKMDPEQPIYAVTTLQEVVSGDIGTNRIAATVSGLFALLALLLATVGIYAVVSRSVSARTREIGLRITLGADASRLRSLVVRQALVPVLLGVAAGGTVTLIMGGVMSGLLYGVAATDPMTLAAAALIFVAAAWTASYIPALRAGRVDPIEALRSE